MYFDKASDIWKALNKRYAQSDSHRISEIQNEIFRNVQGSMSVNEYFTKCNALWQQMNALRPLLLCECTPKCSCTLMARMQKEREDDQVIRFLEGLNDEYETIKSGVLIMDPMPDMEKVLNMTLKVERKFRNFISQKRSEFVQSNAIQNNQTNSEEEQSVVAVSASNGRRKFNNNGGKNVPKCTFCGMLGHTIEKCYKKHGYPPSWVAVYKSKNKQVQEVQQLSNTSVNQVGDIGLSNDQFQRLLSLLQGQNKGSQGSSNAAVSMTNPGLRSDFRNSTNNSTEGMFISHSHTVNAILDSPTVWILDSGATDHITCSMEYFEDSQRVLGIFVKLPNGNVVGVTHIGQIKLSNHIALKNVLYIPSFTFNIIYVSRLAKHFGFKVVLDADSCAIQGNHGMMDGFAIEENELYLINSPPIKKGSQHFDNNCAKVKVVRSNNGTEFMMSAFYNDKGITHQKSCAYTPQKNGVAERKHQHILNVARSLSFQSGLPVQFWGHCVIHASYLINRLPIKILNGRSPLKVLTGNDVDYNQLIAFGCLCFGATVSKGRNKMQSRARKCIFLGYPANVKGYVIYDINNKSVFVSRDVKFYEENYPFKQQCSVENVVGAHNPSLPNIPISDRTSYDSSETIQRVDSEDIDRSLDNERYVIEESEHGSEIIGDTHVHNEGQLNDADMVIDIHLDNDVPEINDEDMADDNDPPRNCTDQPRRSARTKNIPVRLNDYHYQSMMRTSPHQISKFISFDSFVSSITSTQEPQTYHEAEKHQVWREAMESEIEALVQNNTWTLTDLPKGKSQIGCRWVYKVKHKADGSIERYKVRLVVKGYTQQLGVDYIETFSPVARMTTIKTFLALAISRGWDIQQLDINNDFLHGDLKEEVYMVLPPGFKCDKPNQVCKLLRSLYGLKQASRQWNAKLTGALLHYGFHQSTADPSLFTKTTNTSFTALLVYVDDVLVAGNDSGQIRELKHLVDDAFKIKDLGPLNYFLGIEALRTPTGIDGQFVSIDGQDGMKLICGIIVAGGKDLIITNSVSGWIELYKEDKAARVYDLAALKYWGTSTTINFPISNYEKEVEEMKHMTRQEFVAAIRRFVTRTRIHGDDNAAVVVGDWRRSGS
ncbi:PREDICTED: uncharacterized protein LOC109160431 [Ipomoea nil]|uniref:uncharacterized protein LOC109160431 n=1 Tax=Ipomoea nil TaxID=35883 RepID=UPI0009020002|nr:PREDICTED: uncharacterized protein LOC109160431 [Ipomoea nil]